MGVARSLTSTGLETQDRIAVEVNRRHNTAHRRRTESQEGWQAAKERFEVQLMDTTSGQQEEK